MVTLKEMAEKYPAIADTLNDISIGHTDAALAINYLCAHSILGLGKGFMTTEASVRRYRRATIDQMATDAPESNAEPLTTDSGSQVPGSPLNPLEALTAPPSMNILFIDIETSPILAYAWRTRKVYIDNEMIVEPSKILCFAAKWQYESKVIFYSLQDGERIMLSALWNLLNKADVVVHYNGKRFDIPKINTAFLDLGVKGSPFGPPSPYKQVDLLLTVRSTFNFESNKLAYISKRLGVSEKRQTGGIKLWFGCMNNDTQSWLDMEEYNKQDVLTLEECYNIFRPWITAHPSFAAFTGTLVCPTCGNKNLKRDGYYHTSVSRYPRYVCCDCGTWSRGSHRISGAEITGVAL